MHSNDRVSRLERSASIHEVQTEREIIRLSVVVGVGAVELRGV